MRIPILEIARRLKAARGSPITAARTARQAKAAGRAKVARPKTLKAKGGLSIDRALFYTLASRVKNARRHRVTVVAFRQNKAETKIFSKTLTYDKDNGKLEVRPHRHWVEKTDASLSWRHPKQKIKFNCDCPDFMFNFEYAMHHHGAASIKFSNGEFPMMKNPRLKPGLCKHGFVLFRYIKAHRM